MDSIIEVQRQTHEEIEHFERALYQILAKPTPLHQQKVQSEHRASQILDRVSARVNTLNNLYQSDDTRKQEIIAISGSSRADELSEFYSRLGKIQEHHAKYPDGIVDGFELELLALTEDPTAGEGDEDYVEEDRMFNVSLRFHLLVSCPFLAIGNLFSGEESYGKYLDLYTNHTAYNNLRHAPKRVAYLQYLDVLIYPQNDAVHSELPRECRITRDYEKCVT
jgi:splicing factor 3A subunit 3